MVVLFGPFRFLAPKDLKIIWLSNILALSMPGEGYFGFEHAWWRLFWLWAYLVKVILALSIPEGYFGFEHTWWRLFWLWACLMKVMLALSIPGEGYFGFEHTWWRLFWLLIWRLIYRQPVYVGIYLPLAPAHSNYRLETKKT